MSNIRFISSSCKICNFDFAAKKSSEKDFLDHLEKHEEKDFAADFRSQNDLKKYREYFLIKMKKEHEIMNKILKKDYDRAICNDPLRGGLLFQFSISTFYISFQEKDEIQPRPNEKD